MIQSMENPSLAMHRDRLLGRLEAGRPDAEALLLEIARRRDKAAFAQLFTWFAPRVKGQLMATGLDPGRAEDLAQEVLLDVWRKAHLFDPLRGAASTWIYAMARNRFLNTRRGKSSAESDLFAPIRGQVGQAGDAEDPGDAGDPTREGSTGTTVEALMRGERESMLRAALLELPPDQRQALQDVYFSEQTMRASAEQRGIPVGTVKTRVRLALERLRVVVTRRWEA